MKNYYTIEKLSSTFHSSPAIGEKIEKKWEPFQQLILWYKKDNSYLTENKCVTQLDAHHNWTVVSVHQIDIIYMYVWKN